MVYSATEWMAVLANLASGRASLRVLCPSRSGLEGSVVGSLSFGRRACVSSRVGLTEGWRSHNGGRGDVSSSWAPTTPGMVLQCSGWWRSGGDGRTGPMATEKTHLTGPTSRRHPVRVLDRRSYPFRGFCRPLLRVRRAGRTRVGDTVS
jgi:hypothetical protein